MTNADIVSAALERLGVGWHTSREVMWEVRRGGFRMTTQKARSVCKVLHRQGRAHMLVYGNRYSFEVNR